MAVDVRSFWKGHLRLALVTIPIRLVSATEPESEIRLNQVDRKSRQRIRYLKVAAESGEPVENADIVKGVEVDPGRYVLLQEDELDGLKLETRHTVELSSFVKMTDLDAVFYDRPYYVLPDGEIAEEGYRVIADALERAGVVGIGQLTMRGREHLVALSPRAGGLMLVTLRYASEIRDPARIFAGIGEGQLRPELTDMAIKLIDERTEAFDPSRYRNHYREALSELIKTKIAGTGPVDVSGGDRETAPTGNVVDFMEALRRSLEGGEDVKAKGTGRKSGRSRAVASAAKREATKRGQPDAPEVKAKPSNRRNRSNR